MKNRKAAIWVGILLGILMFVFGSVALAATQWTTHVANLNPDPHTKVWSDAWHGYLSTTALSFAVWESWHGGVWDSFEITYETASDIWREVPNGAWSYTDLVYDVDSKPDTLQAVLTDADTAGGEFIVIGYDYDGI